LDYSVGQVVVKRDLTVFIAVSSHFVTN